MTYVIKFGKYTGKTIDEIPGNYYDWLILNVPKYPIQKWEKHAYETICEYEKIHKLSPTRKPTLSVKNLFENSLNSLENNLNNLEWINNVLISTGNNPEDTLKDAGKSLKNKVFINIFDLIEGKYDKTFKTRNELKENIMITGKRFPISKAKNFPLLKLFLVEIF